MTSIFSTLQILAERGYIVRERGVINVKGKGEMLTFYVMGRKISRNWRFGKTVNQNNNSLAEVVYGMVRARKRRTARRGKGIYKYLVFILCPDAIFRHYLVFGVEILHNIIVDIPLFCFLLVA